MGMMWILTGIVAGILVNYLADVLPSTRRLSRPKWWPPSGAGLLEYFSSIRVISVAVIFLMASYLLATNPPSDFSSPILLLLAIYFGLVTVIDIEHRAVLHPVSAGGVLLLGAIGVSRHGIISTLIGGFAGFGMLLLLHYAGGMIAKWIGRADTNDDDPALGLGDVNLSGVIGLLMGWPGIVGALLLGIVLGGVFSLIYMGMLLLTGRYKVFATIPYAPFLCSGALGMVLLNAY
jgi:prepilin signal peptidase PulO-like enzyme (type II secretory pathway)